MQESCAEYQENERKEREAKIWSMWLGCWTQEEIAEAVKLEQPTVNEVLRDLSAKYRENDSDNFRNFEPEV